MQLGLEGVVKRLVVCRGGFLACLAVDRSFSPHSRNTTSCSLPYALPTGWEDGGNTCIRRRWQRKHGEALGGLVRLLSQLLRVLTSSALELSFTLWKTKAVALACNCIIESTQNKAKIVVMRVGQLQFTFFGLLFSVALGLPLKITCFGRRQPNWQLRQTWPVYTCRPQPSSTANSSCIVYQASSTAIFNTFIHAQRRA
jgi:hypothetical protein